MVRFISALILVAGTATAQDWNGRDGDRALSETDMATRLVGKTITFFDGGKSVYFDDGRYNYTYDGGATALGEYRLEDDGVVCIDFANGFARCDRYVLAGEQLVLQTEKGERFPVRSE